MTSILQDLKYAIRGIGRRPGHTALIVITLAIGLGINTVAFSAVNSLLFRAVRQADASSFGWVFAGPAGDSFQGVSLEMFDALRTKATTLQPLVAEGRVPLSAATPEGPAQAWGLAVSSQYFSVVKPRLEVGRVLSPTDIATDAVPILISERYWRNRWNASADLTSIKPVVNGQLTSVIGVVDDSFEGPGGIFEPHLWFPLDAAPLLHLAFNPTDDWLTMMGKPAEGATPTRIGAEVQAIARAVDEARTGGSTPARQRRGEYVTVSSGHPEARGLAAPAAMAMAAVGLVLLIACFNAAGLILARSAERQRELGLRTALGASRMRLTRQLLVEGLVLSSIAGAAALTLAQWSERFLGGLSLPAPIPQRLQLGTDWRVIAFTLLMVLVAATVPVLAPAWQVFRTNPIGWLKAGSTGSGTSHRGRRAWLSFQVAGSTVFLTLALMFVTSYVATVQTNPGFNTTHVAALQVTPTNFSITPERQRALMTELLTRIEGASNIAAVGVTERFAFQVGIPLRSRLSTDGRDCASGPCVDVASTGITPGFFEAMEMRLVAGRAFDPKKAEDTNAAVLSSAAAEALWPGRSPLGQWVYEGAGAAPRQVVGVVADIAASRLDRPNEPAFYRPLTGDKLSGPLTVVARSSVDADAAAAVLRGLWRDLDSTLPPATIQTMDQRLALPRWPSRVGAAFFATCGILAVVLVTIGLFGVTYYAVIQRTKEFGVRLALGATADDLRRLVLGESTRLILPGLAAGLILSAVLASLAQSSLLGVTALDPRWYGAAVALQFSVAIIASWSPARRASRVAPQTTLRGD